MNTQIRYAPQPRTAEKTSLLVRGLRLLILLSVWVLVGLAGFAAWARLTG